MSTSSGVNRQYSRSVRRWRPGFRGSASRLWSARWCRKCKGWPRDRPVPAPPRRNASGCLAASASSSVAAPRPACAIGVAPGTSGAMRALVPGAADEQRGFGVVEEISKLGLGVSGVERQIGGAGAQARQIEGRSLPDASPSGPQPGRPASPPAPQEHSQAAPKSRPHRQSDSTSRWRSRWRTFPRHANDA